MSTAEALLFPSQKWCEAAAKALLSDEHVRAALAEFGPVTAGVVIERGDGLSSDFCALARLRPGKPADLSFPDDEDELEELEPDYIAWAPHALSKQLLRQAIAGGSPDPFRAVLERRIRLKGDLERLVKHAGRHRGAGLEAIRALPTRFHGE
jgi:hypothetical protein